MHHIDDGRILLKQSHKILKSKGSLYIFEPLLRELHQVPEDYGRYTPFLLKKQLKKIISKNFHMNLQVDHLAQLHICGIRLYSIFLKKKKFI